MSRRRLDQELVRQGLVENRSHAQEMIKAGRVTVDGAPADKASRMVAPSQSLQVAGDPPRYVSRGGLKLESALERFNLDIQGLKAIDVGSSTGGFTDCLLQHGVSSVVALDVGRGQLHHRLLTDERVVVHERTNIRHVDPEEIGAPFDLLVADLSFISLTLILGNLFDLVKGESSLLLLVKPQFEAGKRQVDEGKGVIKDPRVWSEVLNEVETSVRVNKAAIIEGMVSPITGAEGNVEFLIRVIKDSEVQEFQTTELVQEAVSLHGDGESRWE
ncbi:MAG TPA: TlyA family RNA methyltransferase [Acidimicrobiales bacterium]|nr:TlyA family RNA methyltransferase [Acidimicrobiales bacterium]